jgi:hypothetical protein
MTDAEPCERVERRARDERTGVIGRDDAVSRCDARRAVAACRARDPVVDVLGCQRDVARPAGRAARRVDANDLGRVDADVRADRIVACARVLQLALVGQGQPRDVGETAAGVVAGELRAVERRALE